MTNEPLNEAFSAKTPSESLEAENPPIDPYAGFLIHPKGKGKLTIVKVPELQNMNWESETD
jgi:hypothetical protein